MGKHASEELTALGVAFGKELRDFETCGGEMVAEGVMTVKSLDAAVDRCLKVSKGISRDYFYRSLYAVQLVHCFKVGG